MNNITSFFDKNKKDLSNNSNDGQDTKKQLETSSLELSFEKASDGDIFKYFLRYEDCILKNGNGRIMYYNKKHKRNSD